MTSSDEMSDDVYQDIVDTLDNLEALASQTSRQNRHIDHELISVISPLLAAEGYLVKQEAHHNDKGMDILATRGVDDVIVVENKFYQSGRKIGEDVVRQLISAAKNENANKALLIVNTGFTASAQDLVRHEKPLELQLLNFEALRNWATRLRKSEDSIELEVSEIMRQASRGLAELIARDGRALAAMEWRDVERVMAEVFEGLGFDTELTPPSKDGGKDVIVSCSIKGKLATYYVEIKHWRSATRVGSFAVQDLLNVLVAEKVEGGLFLSTYGFTSNAFEQLTVIDRAKINFGDEGKIVSLCKTYVRARSGVWSTPEDLSELIMKS